MSLTHKPAGSKILEKIKSDILSRAKLLCSLCHETPCTMLYLHVKKIGNESVDPVKNLDSSYPIKLCFKKQFWKYDIRLLCYILHKQTKNSISNSNIFVQNRTFWIL